MDTSETIGTPKPTCKLNSQQFEVVTRHPAYVTNIIQWNVNKLLSCITELDVIWRKYAPAVVCLQETHLCPHIPHSETTSHTIMTIWLVTRRMVVQPSLSETAYTPACPIIKHHRSSHCTVILCSPKIYSTQCMAATPHHCWLGRPPGPTLPAPTSCSTAGRLQCTPPRLGQCRRR